MLISKAIDSIKENLGNRSSGVIGGTPVNTVVLAGINKGMKQIIKVARPDYYDRLCEVSLIPDLPDETPAVVGLYDYPRPVVDIDGETIKIKQILSTRLTRDGETSIYGCTQLTASEYAGHRKADTEEAKVPSAFLYYNNRLRFTTYPDDYYTLLLVVTTSPVDYTTTQVNTTEFPVDDLWIEVVEAYATYYCFSKLQQTKDAQFWFAAYADGKRETKAVFQKQPNLVLPHTGSFSGADPLTDPFNKRFNVG